MDNSFMTQKTKNIYKGRRYYLRTLEGCFYIRGPEISEERYKEIMEDLERMDRMKGEIVEE